MEKIKNSDFIANIAKETGLTKKQTTEFVRIVFNEIKKQLASGLAVSIFGFGTFSVALRKARMGKNPSTNEPMEIPAKTYPVFKACAAFKNEVNK